MERSPLQLLQQYWGHAAFRPLQEDIIQSVLSGHDTVAILPTGGGKSICYQVPALMQEGLCIVISPLIALMKDQVANLKQRGIQAAALFSGMSLREIDITLDNCIYGRHKFLYVSPERLQSKLLQERLQKMQINLIAVDEAHCISQWGYDFRPPYLQIAQIRELLPDIPMLALTATATPKVKTDIQERLKFNDGQSFQASFARPNLVYVTRKAEDKNNKLQVILSKIAGSSIVYVRNRRKTREIAQWLASQRISADYYHAGLKIRDRDKKQQAWMEGRTRVMVCTNAFGMGIDKPDVRTVVHMDVPDDMESYYQEAGRAGRDGRKSFATIIYNEGDIKKGERRIKQGLPKPDEIKKVYNGLCNHLKIANGSGEGESYDFDLAGFAQNRQLDLNLVHQSLKVMELEGILLFSDAVLIPSRLMMKASKEDLYSFQVANSKFDGLLQYILRNCVGVFNEYVTFNEQQAAKAMETSGIAVIKALRYLHQLELIDYHGHSELPKVTFLQGRVEVDRLPINAKQLEQRAQLKASRISYMLNYAQQDKECRSQKILGYFSETDSQPCGICDVCLSNKKVKGVDNEAIINEIRKCTVRKGYSIDGLIGMLSQYREERVLKIVQELLEEGQLMRNSQNQLIWRL